MQASETDFWQVFRNSRNPMLLLDGRRRYTAANDAACERFGMPRDELLRARAGDRTPADLRHRLEDALEQLRAGEPLTTPWAFLRPDGTRHELFVHIHPRALGDLDLVIVLDAPPRVPVGALTPREREITALLAEGCDGPEIAERLVLSPETVRTHVRNAMERVNARTRAHLIAIALRERLIEL